VLRDDPVAIVGVSVPKVARVIPNRTSFGLTLECVREALADAGVTKEEVNGACVAWPGPGGSPQGGSSNWARQLGVTLNWVVEQGLDAIGVRAVLHAAAAIQAGLCETVVIGAAVAGVEGMREASAAVTEPRVARMEWTEPWGAELVPRLALTARRHMHDYGTTREQLAAAAAEIRNHGSVNPEATFFGKGPYTVDDVLASPMIAEPLHLLDLGLIGQGGCAIVMTTGERARALVQHPVYVLAGAMELTDAPHARPSLVRDEGMLGRARMERAYSHAGVSPRDVDLLSVYDATSFEVIRTIEMLGFCEPGEGGPFVEGGTLSRGGRLPTNTDGGLLAHGFAMTAQLLMKVVEAVRQLRGMCGARQVKGAELAVCTNAVATAHHLEALVLARG
jgi:acetyl-CoA acetyltransferase